MLSFSRKAAILARPSGGMIFAIRETSFPAFSDP
jgi:hypothetical protein